MDILMMAIGLSGAITGLLAVLGVSGIVLPVLGILLGVILFSFIVYNS